MPVYGVGIDLVKSERIQQILGRWGDRFESRVFTSGETAACSKRKQYARCLAMRFAAKEAFAKALGTGMRAPISWLDIEVRSNELGKPDIVLSPRALRFCEELGVRSWHLSLTDEGDYGAAVVVVEA
jgi:holo-[acyl-carrier protein] synthase